MGLSGIECRSFGNYLGASPWGRRFACGKVGETTLDRCLTCPHHQPIEFPNWSWATAITTAPRIVDGVPGYPYLDATLVALDASGFPHGKLYDDKDRQLGAWGNFHRAALDLTLRHPHVSGYLILQDDTVLEPGAAALVAWLMRESHLQVAVASLYNPPDLASRHAPLWVEHGGHAWRRRNMGWDAPGACAYAFSAWGLRDLLCDPHAYWHRRWGPTGGKRCTDSVVGVWAAQHGGIWHRDEPLARHIGEVSACEKP